LFLPSLAGAIVFYTRIPLPAFATVDFNRIARWATIVGMGIGAIVTLCWWGLRAVGMPLHLHCTIVLLLWLWITGGLHLDGAMDSADGLAVEESRRLEVMADSRSGAFGVMSAIAILALKWSSLLDLATMDLPVVVICTILVSTAGWGRWGQILAIAIYPYLKPTGKGAFHKESIHPVTDVCGSFFAIVISVLLITYSANLSIALEIAKMAVVATIAWLVGAYFQANLKGQTGDSYGAIVEWTEAIVLLFYTASIHLPSSDIFLNLARTVIYH
jgi:adenosylcobinamide-GDP ribazoletransferase